MFRVFLFLLLRFVPFFSLSLSLDDKEAERHEEEELEVEGFLLL